MRTLGEIVHQSLLDAEQGIKVASRRDAAVEDRSFAQTEDWLSRELGQAQEEEEPPPTQKQASAAAQGDDVNDDDDVSFALKLAQACEAGAALVTKLASEGGKPTAAGGQKAGPTPLYPLPPAKESVTIPRTQASAHALAAQADGRLINGRPATYGEGPSSQEGPVVPPGGFGGHSSKRLGNAKVAEKRAATERLIATKMAQFSALKSLGQIEAADEALKQAQLLKRAADSLVFPDNYQGANFPDNDGVRNLTKAQARDANQRQAGAYFGEPVKRDNAVAATQFRTDGLKLSSAQALLKAAMVRKQAGGFLESYADLTSRLRANSPLQAARAGAMGAATGAFLGKGSRAATAVGAGLGALAGGAFGHYSAKGEQAMRERLRKQAGILDTVGGAVAGAGAKVLRGGTGAALKGVGKAAPGGAVAKGLGHVANATNRGANALSGLGDTGKKVLGGAVLGTSALGTAGLARRALGGGNGQ